MTFSSPSLSWSKRSVWALRLPIGTKGIAFSTQMHLGSVFLLGVGRQKGIWVWREVWGWFVQLVGWWVWTTGLDKPQFDNAEWGNGISHCTYYIFVGKQIQIHTVEEGEETLKTLAKTYNLHEGTFPYFSKNPASVWMLNSWNEFDNPHCWHKRIWLWVSILLLVSFPTAHAESYTLPFAQRAVSCLSQKAVVDGFWQPNLQKKAEHVAFVKAFLLLLIWAALQTWEILLIACGPKSNCVTKGPTPICMWFLFCVRRPTVFFSGKIVLRLWNCESQRILELGSYKYFTILVGPSSTQPTSRILLTWTQVQPRLYDGAAVRPGVVALEQRPPSGRWPRHSGEADFQPRHLGVSPLQTL